MRIFIKCIKIFITGVLGIIVLILITVAINRTLASKWMLEVSKKELSTPNPTSYVFNHSLSYVRESILKKFERSSFREFNLYGKGSIWGSKDPHSDYNFFEQPGNEKDFVLSGRIAQSFSYRTGNRGRYCNMRLQIHLDSISPSETKIEVISHDRQIISGYKLGIAHMSFIIPIFQTYEPTTIEEYQVLYNIGKYLGVDMPKVIYPKDLSEQQIFETFCNGQEHLITSERRNFLTGNEK